MDLMKIDFLGTYPRNRRRFAIVCRAAAAVDPAPSIP
jgi:hypothetical protein